MSYKKNCPKPQNNNAMLTFEFAMLMSSTTAVMKRGDDVKSEDLM
jgi:hypothetical protein